VKYVPLWGEREEEKKTGRVVFTPPVFFIFMLSINRICISGQLFRHFSEIDEEGIAPLNKVAGNIKRILIQKKKADLLKKELASAKSGSESLLSIARKAGLEVKEANEISFNSFQIPGAGIEPKVIAASSITEQGKISEPIAGNQGVYLILVNNRTTRYLLRRFLSVRRW